MTPEVELSKRPAGKDGLMDQLVMAALPLTCGSIFAVVPTVNVVELAKVTLS
jgi:hypothetical protein